MWDNVCILSMTSAIYLHHCWHTWLSSSQDQLQHAMLLQMKAKACQGSFPFTPVSWVRWHWNFQKVAEDRGRKGRNCCAGKLHCNRINHRRATGVAFFCFPFLLREWDRAWPRRQTPDRLLYLNMNTLRCKSNSLVLRCEKLVFLFKTDFICLETIFPTAFGTNTQ